MVKVTKKIISLWKALPIFLMVINSCVPIPVISTKKKSGARVGDNKRVPSAKFFRGELLYKANCASCHTDQVTKLPSKLDRSYADIQGAVDSIQLMSNLSNLSERDLRDISAYLDSAKFYSGGATTSKLKYQMPLGTRKFVTSKLREIFIGSGSNAAVETHIALIENFPGYFGGICTYKYENCKGSADENISTRMIQFDNIARRGYIGRTCQNVVQNDSAVDTALSHAGLNINSTATSINIRKLFDIFSPGQELDTTSVQDIIALHNSTEASQSRSKWRMVIYSFCVSPSFEVH